MKKWFKAITINLNLNSKEVGMVRIGFVSDLHVDFNRRHDFISTLTELVAKKHLDQLVIMGDTANGLERNLAFDDQLVAKLPVPFQTLIGNHDLYVDHPRQKRLARFSEPPVKRIVN